jgi:mRNA interferase YafQ
MLTLRIKNSYKKDVRKLHLNQKTEEIVRDIVLRLMKGEILEKKYNNHELKGKWIGSFDCHILPDLVLVYQLTKTEVILVRLGNHSELF